MLFRSLSISIVVATLFVTGCGVEVVVHGLKEKEANQILVLFAKHGVSAQKMMIDNGRSVEYNLAVPVKHKLLALRLMQQHDYPRRVIKGYSDVFAEGGLIPTSAEEKAKKLSAIEGEIERQLMIIDDILDVQVNIVMPDENALRTNEDTQVPTTAAVTVKYLPGANNIKPLNEIQVASIVAAGVEKLTSDQVVVVMTPGQRLVDSDSAIGAGMSGSGTAGISGNGPLGKLSAKVQTMLTVGVVVIILLLAVGLFFGQLRLKAVRGRLLRLQNEIAKARRRPGEA